MLCPRQGHKIEHFLCNLLPFSPETLWEIVVLQRISIRNSDLVQNRAVIHCTFVILGRLVTFQLLVGWKRSWVSYLFFGFFFIRIAWWSDMRIIVTEFSNNFLLDRGSIRGYPLCGSCWLCIIWGARIECSTECWPRWEGGPYRWGCCPSPMFLPDSRPGYIPWCPRGWVPLIHTDW